MPYRSTEDAPLAEFPLRSVGSLRVFVIASLLPAIAALGLLVIQVAVLCVPAAFGESVRAEPLSLVELLVVALLVGFPFAARKLREPYLVAGPSPALRIFRDRVEVPAARTDHPLRLPLDDLRVQRTSHEGNQVGAVRLGGGGHTRVLSTRVFRSEEESDRAVRQILAAKETSCLAAELPTAAARGAGSKSTGKTSDVA